MAVDTSIVRLPPISSTWKRIGDVAWNSDSESSGPRYVTVATDSIAVVRPVGPVGSRQRQPEVRVFRRRDDRVVRVRGDGDHVLDRELVPFGIRRTVAHADVDPGDDPPRAGGQPEHRIPVPGIIEP